MNKRYVELLKVGQTRNGFSLGTPVIVTNTQAEKELVGMILRSMGETVCDRSFAFPTPKSQLAYPGVRYYGDDSGWDGCMIDTSNIKTKPVYIPFSEFVQKVTGEPPKEFTCKVYWEMTGEVKVMAKTPEEASKIAMTSPLPSGEYVMDSVNCDPETDVQEVK